MNHIARKKHERAMRWEKHKEEKALEQILLGKMRPIAEKLTELAVDGNMDAIKYSMDRVFGKPQTSVDVDMHNAQPIIFMPTVLVEKFRLKEPQATLNEPEILSIKEAKKINVRTRSKERI